jgi:hypothetical protein
MSLLLASVCLPSPPDPHTPWRPRAPSRSKMDADPVVVPMRLKDGRIELDVRVDGKDPVPFVLERAPRIGPRPRVREGRGPEAPRRRPDRKPGRRRARRQACHDGRRLVGGLHVKNVPGVAFAPWPFPPPPRWRAAFSSPYGLALASSSRSTIPASASCSARERSASRREGDLQLGSRARPSEIPITVRPGRPSRRTSTRARPRGLSLQTSSRRSCPRLTAQGDRACRLVDRELVVRGAKLDGGSGIGRYVLERPRWTSWNIGMDILGERRADDPEPAHDSARSCPERLRSWGPGRKLIAAARPKRYGVKFVSPTQRSGDLQGRAGRRAESGEGRPLRAGAAS